MLPKVLRAFAIPIAIVGVLALPGPAAAGGDRHHRDDDGSFAARVAGSYLIQHDSDDSRDVLTVGADGTFLVTSSTADALGYGDSQGAWKRTGRRSISAKVVNFDFDHDGVAVVRFAIAFDRRHGRVTGDFSGAIYPSAVSDPLAPDLPPISEFADGFSGRRIVPD